MYDQSVSNPGRSHDLPGNLKKKVWTSANQGCILSYDEPVRSESFLSYDRQTLQLTSLREKVGLKLMKIETISDVFTIQLRSDLKSCDV